MRALRLGLVIALIATVGIAILGTPSARAEFLAPDIGVRFPDALAGLQLRGEPHRYPQPGLGYSLNYAGPNISVDVYVYNADQRGIGTGVGAPVTQQFAQAEGEMQAYYRMQRQQAQRVDGGPQTLGTAPRQTQWLVARYNVQRGNQQLRSVVMVTGFRDYFVKVRATFAADGKASDDPLAPFAAELSTLLASSPPPGNPPPGNPPAGGK
jgi:hypothetical protein